MSTKRKGPPAKPAQAMPAAPGAIDVDALAAKVRAAVDPQLQPVFDKVVLSGMRIMFDKASHQMALAELDAPGPMPQKLADGIVKLTYLLWTQSNKTIPPKIIIAVTTVLTLRAFEFLQESQNPDATKETLGEATALVTQGVLDGFHGAAQPLQQASGMLAAGGTR